MSDHLFNPVKSGGQFGPDVVGGHGAAVGFADAGQYYYASSALNAILQTQFQAAGWPTGNSVVANNGDVKGAIMVARDQYYAKFKSAVGGVFVDFIKENAVDLLHLLSLRSIDRPFFGLSTPGTKNFDYSYGYSNTPTRKNTPDANGPPKDAATALIRASWQLNNQTKFSGKSKEAAAFEALKQIVGPFEFELQGQIRPLQESEKRDQPHRRLDFRLVKNARVFAPWSC